MSAQFHREVNDPYCLREGEAERILQGHPWRRFVAIGDSVVSGQGDQVEGYHPLPWADRIASELGWAATNGAHPRVDYVNLGKRDLTAAEVRATQLEAALAAGPDLALVACGANDALKRTYDPENVDAELAAIIVALREQGAEVMTVGLFDSSNAPMFPVRVKHLIGGRMRTFSRRTGDLARRLGTLHINLTGHPAEADPTVYSSDGMHGNMRAHAICAAEAIRRLGRRLGTITYGGAILVFQFGGSVVSWVFDGAFDNANPEELLAFVASSV